MPAPLPHLRPVRRPLRGWAALIGWLVVASALAAANPPGTDAAPLTFIREIRALPAEKANEARPVLVRGVVTRITQYEMFLQDGPDAIFIWQENRNPELRVGDFVEVRGVTHSGHLFPIIRSSRLTRLDHRALPEPQYLRYAELATGRGDCSWIEVAGVVQAVEDKPDGTRLLRLSYDGALLKVDLASLDAGSAARLLGARVRLRGVANGLKTLQRRLIEPVVCTDGTPDTFWIEEPGPADVFALPLQAVDALGGPGGDSPFRNMVRVAGVVTSLPGPQLIFIRDEAQSLEIRLSRPAALRVGDRIEAAGFAEMGLIQPILNNALARRVADGPPPAPRRLRSAAELLDPRNEAELVEVEAELHDASRRNDGWVMLLTDAGVAFSVEVSTSDFIPPPAGSRLALVGISQIERVTPPDLNQLVAPAAVLLHLRSPDEMRILSRPSWWTPRRLLVAVGVLSLLSLGALGWVWTLNRRVQAQTRIILDHARTQATLEERNRIARELHDTVEQELAGATILLDAIDTVVVDQPQRAREGLQTARAMLRHSLDEAQQAVANLRNNALFEREFAPLIEAAVHERLASTGIEAEFRYDGTWPDLDSIVKQHLLRIVQESVTNAVKHASPSRIIVALRAGAGRPELEVSDDGCGFTVPQGTRRSTSEFGLIGLQERAEKIGARLVIQSAPSRGTTVRVALRPDDALSAV